MEEQYGLRGLVGKWASKATGPGLGVIRVDSLVGRGWRDWFGTGSRTHGMRSRNGFGLDNFMPKIATATATRLDSTSPNWTSPDFTAPNRTGLNFTASNHTGLDLDLKLCWFASLHLRSLWVTFRVHCD